ncbi:MAG: sigma-E processing peptidase SpoIIGA [Clostridia bacterium]|nr:sigma-E processing peptidase SpoIIGA [Clostridia bacterium]
MEVYIEYVIIDNLIIDMLVLLCIKATMKLNAKFWRLFLSASFGTAFACAMPLLQFSNAILLPLKLLVGVVMVLIIAKYSRIKEFLFAYLLLLIYTILFVGACIVTLLLFGTDIEHLARGYSSEFPVSIVILMVAFYVAIIISIAKYLTRKRDISPYIKNISLKIAGRTLNINGFVDTGNNLIDQKTGLPVMILSLSCLEKYFTSQQIQSLMLGCKDKSLPFKDVHTTSYGTLSGQDRKMIVFSSDGLCIKQNEGEYKTNNFLVGVTYRKFNDAIKYDILLNPSVL